MKNKNLKWKTIILLLIMFILLGIFIFFSIKTVYWLLDNHNTNKQHDNIEQINAVKEITDNENTEIIEQEEIDPDNPYWDYIKMNMIDVDHNKLKEKNLDYIGWIQVNGTNINYPFVQSSNNKYYLKHSFDKSNNNAGWLFLDYRNNSQDFDKNSIIYGHGRIDETMFGSLKNILNDGWLDDKDNYVIKLSTKSENTLWQIFSVYQIPTTSDYLQIAFKDDLEFLDFTKKLIDRSDYDFKTKVNKNDKILTLSTCYNKTDKLVVHAKLIKKAKK